MQHIAFGGVFRRWIDPYTLGAFAVKSGLHNSTHLLTGYLRNPADQRSSLYRRGAAEAAMVPWCDLAYEMLTIQRIDSHAWADMLQQLEPVVAATIRAVIATARDWETQERIRAGCEILRDAKK
jgi:hypothetical protein